MVENAQLIKFDSGYDSPWGFTPWSRAKAQFCILTCKAYLSTNASVEEICPWMHCAMNVYLLVARQSDPLMWDRLGLTKEQEELLNDHKELVLGYVVVDAHEHIHWIQSFVKQQGVMKKILQELGNKFELFKVTPYDLRNAPPYVINIWTRLGFVRTGASDT